MKCLGTINEVDYPEPAPAGFVESLKIAIKFTREALDKMLPDWEVANIRVEIDNGFLEGFSVFCPKPSKDITETYTMGVAKDVETIQGRLR